MTFTYVSLFSGAGGFEQALNKLGGKCVMASEIDKFANKAYEVLYGEPTVGDVTEIEAEDVPDHDLLVGGFPCQAFSVAGKRLGFEDTRGTLFFEMARIAKAKKPKVILAENVKGLVGHDKGRTLNVIIQTLCDIGYTVDFNVLNSKYFGVPQNRERIFIVAVRDDLVEQEPWMDVKGNTVVPKGKRRIQQLEGVKTFNFDWPPQEEVTTRLRDILESEVDERFYLDEEKTAKLIAELEGKESGNNPTIIDPSQAKREGKPRLYQDVSPTITARDYKEPRMVGQIEVLGHLNMKGHRTIREVLSPEGISTTLTTMGGGHREPKIAEARPVLTPDKTPIEYSRKNGIGKEIEQAHTLSASDWRGLNRNQTQNAVLEVRPVLTPDRETKRQNGRRFKDDGEESSTLTAQDRHGIAVGTPPRYRIRKLTPRECFRLQGFPDSEFDKLVAAGISNSQLYKMAGNAVTVNVIDAIGRRLLPFLN
jgi:DNA (cytosine-5)-methyltransferase 1